MMRTTKQNQRSGRHVLLFLSLATIGGCATAPDAGRMQPLGLLPNIDCEGKAAITINGSLAGGGGIGGGGSSSGSLQVDCGDGFKLLHPEARPNGGE
jgi:hypothetical protein